MYENVHALWHLKVFSQLHGFGFNIIAAKLILNHYKMLNV